MEILFRGQTPDGRWLYGGIMRFGDVYYISYIDDNGALHNTEIKSGTVQQYTNVDDDNLSKIFMGDDIIISDVFNEKDNRLGEVSFEDGSFVVISEVDGITYVDTLAYIVNNFKVIKK